MRRRKKESWVQKSTRLFEKRAVPRKRSQKLPEAFDVLVGQRLDRLGLLGGIYVVYAYRIHIGRFSPLDAVQNIFKYGAVLGS